MPPRGELHGCLAGGAGAPGERVGTGGVGSIEANDVHLVGITPVAGCWFKPGIPRERGYPGMGVERDVHVPW